MKTIYNENYNLTVNLKMTLQRNYDPDFDLPCIIGAATHWEMEDYGKQVSKYHSEKRVILLERKKP